MSGEFDGPPCLACAKGCADYFGAIFTVQNVGRCLCTRCDALPRVPLFTVSDLEFDQIAPPPALPPRAVSDWIVEHTSVLGIPAGGVRIVWRCQVVSFEPHVVDAGRVMP